MELPVTPVKNALSDSYIDNQDNTYPVTSVRKPSDICQQFNKHATTVHDSSYQWTCDNDHKYSSDNCRTSDNLQRDDKDIYFEPRKNYSICSDSDDEVNSSPVRALLVPSTEQGPIGAPLRLEVDLTDKSNAPTCVPLCAITNPRSGWNKIQNIRTFLSQIGPDIMILSEHWGRRKSFEKALSSEHYKVKESSRGILGIPTKARNGSLTTSVTGGGVAILYCQKNFVVEDAEIEVPEGIEAAWVILTPRNSEIDTVKKILVGGIYIAPRSLYKQETVDHIVETMFYVQSLYDSQVRFIISGDFNKVDIQDVLHSNGALNQVCSVPTRKASTLELVITCMATMFHPPTTLDPINQDNNSKGKPSDHNVIIVAPKTDLNFKLKRRKKKIEVRPQPKSKVSDFIREMGSLEWKEIFEIENAHEKAQNFHKIMTQTLDKHIKVKTVNMTSLDKPWFNPALKLKYNEMQKEYFSNRKSDKWKRLRKAFRASKKKASREFYSKFVTTMKTIQPSLYHKTVKQIAGFDQKHQDKLVIECLQDLQPQEQVQKVAESFAKVSQEYCPIDLTKLPAYLPAEQPPQLHVYDVYTKIQNQKRTKSTLPIDLPENLRREAAEFLAEPLTDIFNTCLREGVYPRIWKHEWCTPVPKKKSIPKGLKDVRKIACTSDYSKMFEHFLLKFVQQDISDKLSKRQYGGRKGVGTEHLIVSMLDRIMKLLDDPEKMAVILSSYDWSGAFDRIDPTKFAVKMINLGIRSSIAKVIIDFLNERKMEVKMNNHTSTHFDLVGGGPQGSLIGQLIYIISSDDAAEDIPDEDKFKYVDDLSAVDKVTTDQLQDYDVLSHVPSDVATGQKFLAPITFKTQEYNNSISQWTTQNKMVLNEDKSNYMVFSKSKEPFATRIFLNQTKLERQSEIVHLGLWITENLTWSKQITEMCKKAYPRVKMLTKLKYVGVKTEDLIELYCMHIRSLTEYCSTVFHSSLTQKLSSKIEAIQKTCLRVILGVMYVDYNAALEMCGLKTLHERREHRGIKFAIKCITHPTNSEMFPLNPSKDTHLVRNREHFKVNKCHTEKYKKSTIPNLQVKLNSHMESIKK